MCTEVTWCLEHFTAPCTGNGFILSMEILEMFLESTLRLYFITTPWVPTHRETSPMDFAMIVP